MEAREPSVLDVSRLPTYAFGSRGVVWWGVLVFVAIEATMLAMCLAAYFYLRSRGGEWPPGNKLPALGVATASLLVMLVSIAPMVWTELAARHMDRRRIRIGLALSLLCGVVFSVLRVFEFRGLNVWWNDNAYGSIVWTTLGLHTGHIIAEVVETAVILAIMLRRRPLEERYYSDVEDNALYWYFIVAVWVPSYVVIYLFPRWTS